MPAVFIVSGCASLDADQYRFFHKCASMKKRLQAERFIHQEDANRCLIAESLLKYMVQKTVTSNSGTIAFNKFGKPFFTNIFLHFNLSHSDDYVVCAIDKHEIGIDIEKIDNVDKEIGRRFFSPLEVHWIQNSSSEDESLNRFFRIWTLKESYLKALGTGLYFPLNSFSVVSENGVICPIHDSKKKIDWTLRSIIVKDSYHCALCSANISKDFELRFMTVDKLCEEFRHNTFSLSYEDKSQTEAS